MKKQNNSYRTIVILLFITMLIGNVLALDKSLGLSQTQITALANKNITNIEVIEYPCDKDHKCFAVDGDIKEKLVSIPLRVKDNCITKTVWVNRTKIITTKSGKNKTKIYPIPIRTCTGVYNYRDITQKEINYLTEKSLNKKLADKVPEIKVDTYYPIPDNTNVKLTNIEIGKSAGSWIDTIKKILGLI